MFVRLFFAILPIWLAFSANAQEPTPNEKLAAQAKEFVPHVEEVIPGVHVALYFGLPNSILIVGDGANIIIDTMESERAAKAVKSAFDAISTQPVAAIIYTHNHHDHVNGAKVFAEGANPEIIAHASLDAKVRQIVDELQDINLARGMRQFGVPIPQKDYLGAGIGPRPIMGMPGINGYIPPTKTFEDILEITIAGVKLKLVHAPGETDDQIYVVLPEKKVLFPGDNIYKAFPNLYAIRGTEQRDVGRWVASLDAMIAENAEYLVPGHTDVVTGADVIHALLTDYRDAIAFVLAEALKGINAGKTPDELAAEIKLPERFAKHAYLQEFYGTVPWSVRAIYTAHLGWFDGNPTNLFPLPPKERAEKFIELAGGQDALLLKAEEALNTGEWQWAAELADNVLALDKQNAQAKKLKARALVEMAGLQTSANARNYYLTAALQLGGF